MMLESINFQYEDTHWLLEEWAEVARLTILNEEAVTGIVTFLEQFREATKAFV